MSFKRMINGHVVDIAGSGGGGSVEGAITSETLEDGKIWTGTTAEFNLISPKDENTLYHITDDATDVLDNVPTQGSSNGVESGGVYAAINAKANISALGDVNLSSPSANQVLSYNGTLQKWENKTPSAGHVMLPVPSSMLTASQLVAQVQDASNTNENVNSLWGLKTWSNCDVVTLLSTVAQGEDTVGDWEDNWTASGASRSGWLWDPSLYGVLSDNSVEIEVIFDISDSEVVSVYAYRVDDDITNDGVNGGAIALKLNGAIQNASGVKVGVNLKRQRTNVKNFTVLS